jgi:hypothetical protein
MVDIMGEMLSSAEKDNILDAVLANLAIGELLMAHAFLSRHSAGVQEVCCVTLRDTKPCCEYD